MIMAPFLLFFLGFITVLSFSSFDPAEAILLLVVPVLGGGMIGLFSGKFLPFSLETGHTMSAVGAMVLGFAIVSLGTAIGFGAAPSGDFQFEGEASPMGGTVGPVEVDTGGIRVEATVRQSIEEGERSTFKRWSFVTVELLDENKEYLAGFGGEFWHEAGYDEGRWQEDDKLYSAMLQIPSSGTYYLDITTETNVDSTELSPIQVTLSERQWWWNPVPFRNAALFGTFFGLLLLIAPRAGTHPSKLPSVLDEGVRVRFEDQTWRVRRHVDVEYEDWQAEEWTLQPRSPGTNTPRYLEREYEEHSDWEQWLISRPVEGEAIEVPDVEGSLSALSRYVAAEGVFPEAVVVNGDRYSLDDQGEAHRDGKAFTYRNYSGTGEAFVTIEGTDADRLDAVVGDSIQPSAVSVSASQSDGEG